MELESNLAKELYNKVIVPIQTKNKEAQIEYDVNNTKSEEELIAQREQEESKKKAAIEGIKAIAAEKAQREAAEKANQRAEEERIAREAAIKAEEERISQYAATTAEEGPLPVPPPVSSPENIVNDSQGQSIMPPTPPTIQTCRANERDINPSEDCNPSTQKPKPKAWLRFHPDKNEKCADVATEKFKELTNVCKTYTSSPSQPEPSETPSQPEPSEPPTIDILEPLSSETPSQPKPS